MTEKPKIIKRVSQIKRRAIIKEFSFDQQDLPRQLTDALNMYHQSSWDAYKNLPFPSRKEEPWRRTDIRALAIDKFRRIEQFSKSDFAALDEQYLQPFKDGKYAGQIILNGNDIQQILSAEAAGKGVLYTDFRSAEENNSQLLSTLLGEIIQAEDGKFAALASALGQHGVFLYVPKHVVIEAPFHSLIWGAPAFSATLTHIFVWLEEGASVTFVHESASPTFLESAQAFHSGIVELHVGEGAKLNFIELQSWGEHVWSFSHERAQVLRDGRLDWIFGAIGTRLSKNFSDIDLLGAGARARMTGFYFCDAHQHLDHDTQQNHLAPYTTSDLLYKGALFGSSRSVWQGMIYVAPNAMRTDGYQGNKNLILSKEARVDSIPGLEILTDDVRCSHGATVGRIDENELFYMQSRGIPKREAERLIVKGFFSEILDRIPINLIRERFERAIDRKMVNRES